MILLVNGVRRRVAAPPEMPSSGRCATSWGEVARAAGGFRVERVVVAMDCGLVVNQSGAEAPVQGGVLDGVSAALYGGVTVEEGGVRETNFERYRLIRDARSASRGDLVRLQRGAALGAG